MNVHQLKVFLEICKVGTLSSAADRLELKQPTVSFHLRNLEEELDVELFRKQGRTLQPTVAAEELLPYARRIVALMDDARRQMRSRSGHERVRLRLGASYTPATYFMPPYLAEFRQSNPDIELQLTVKQAGGTLAMLRGYEIDAAIVSLPDHEEKGLIVVPLVEDELQLVMNPAHPLSQMSEWSVDLLKDQIFLLHEPGSTSRRLTEQWAQDIGLSFSSTMELGAIETIKETLRCNDSLAVLPLRSILRETQSGELVSRPLPGYINRRRICLAYRDEPLYSAPVREFIRYVEEVADTLKPKTLVKSANPKLP
ncbi:LysR family transcriptional regulator [Saccharibacillus sp. JS10]|uniref:LysR family transcriptional regulator n=1 Tax=Saccharibacillus sp. JS10 TaxID=2950552 RepID=UPI00210BB1BE|nr:LysR family transcriptional regulator [Saccharibacillus sp. JS10]MCQ4087312.1 LysR family transcriptional regulator [Saccharibacillus sp. JS10]